MTEYDYSPEAVDRHIKKMKGIARWRDDIGAIRPSEQQRQAATPAVPRRSTTMPDDHVYSAKNIHGGRTSGGGGRERESGGGNHKRSSSRPDERRHHRHGSKSVPVSRYPSPSPPLVPPIRYAPQPIPPPPVRAVTYGHPPPGIQQPYQNPHRAQTVIPQQVPVAPNYTGQYPHGHQVFLPPGYQVQQHTGPKSPTRQVYYEPAPKTGFFSKLTGMFGGNRSQQQTVTRRKSSKSSYGAHSRLGPRTRRSSY